MCRAQAEVVSTPGLPPDRAAQFGWASVLLAAVGRSLPPAMGLSARLKPKFISILDAHVRAFSERNNGGLICR